MKPTDEGLMQGKDDTKMVNHTPIIEVDDLESRIIATGDKLLSGFMPVVNALSKTDRGPQQLATRLGVNKVLTSRFLKAMRTPDPVSAVHRMPGPEPLRRLLNASAGAGVDKALIQEANDAVDAFERLIQDEIGDRSALESIISAWVPEARREFELRRKQAAFRAISQLRGSHCKAIAATVILHPSEDGEHIDVVWVNGLIGLQRSRANAGVKIATRRIGKESGGRLPRTLKGSPVDCIGELMLEDFCSEPLPPFTVQHIGESVHYSMGGTNYGPNSSVDFIFAESNMGELDRNVPPGSNRRRFVFAEVSMPSGAIQFDALIHRDLGGSLEPRLDIYDTSFEGVASVNDPARDIDQISLLESVESLGWGISSTRSADIPHYPEVLANVLDQSSWNPSDFHVFRCRSEFPLYGSQIVFSWKPE